MLFREWIDPLVRLSEVTEIYSSVPFLWAFGLFMLLDYVKVPAIAGTPLKLLIAMAISGYLHFPETFLSGGWLGELSGTLLEDMQSLLRGNIADLSPPARTFSFLAGWALLISVVQTLVLQRQHAFWFVLLSLFYLILLPVGFGLDTTPALLRTLGLGLLLQALVQLPRLEQRHGLAPRRALPAAWLAAAALLAAGCMLAGYGGAQLAGRDAPSADWRRLTPALERWLEPYAPGAALAPRGQTGYSGDDAVLGEPLAADARVAFVARTPRLTYWRGEAKASYDGRGWRPAASRLERAEALETNEPAPDALAQDVLPRQRGLGRQLFAAGDIVRVETMRSERGEALSGAMLWADAASGRTFIPQLADELGYYRIWSVPVPAEPRPDGSAPASPPEGSAAYLQLPDNLPARVADLTKRITASAAAPFDQAKAVEAYLRANYAYTLNETKPPAAGEDFVDHFLFVQKQGYCNHFSTAMAVMLRTIGIPTRWVKGFAPGTVVAADAAPFPDEAGGRLTVEVTAKDAHSWVEAYIPGTGWVAFEPTPGFQAAESRSQGLETVSAQASAAAVTTASLNAEPAFRTDPAAWLNSFRSAGSFSLLGHNMTIAAAAMGLLLFAALAARRLHLAGGPAAAVSVYAPPPVKMLPAVKLLDRLWRKWAKRHGPPVPGQTVREYMLSRPFATEAERQAAMEFVRLVEAASYNAPSGTAITKRQVIDIWRTMTAKQRSK
nr:transglutaminase-like domain-containing protein [Paenibacillus hamazuiensis]